MRQTNPNQADFMSKLILTADDSPSVRQMVTFCLQRGGYSVLEARDGVEALEKMEANSIHMLVTDLNMPGLDGIELIRKVRALPQYRYIPIVMLTTESQAQKREAGRAAGATGWVVKPFTSEQLLSVITKVLR